MASRVDVPFLNLAEDVLLRPWVLGDLPLVQEAAADEYIPQITTIPAEFSLEAGEAFIRRQWGRASTGTGCPFVIVRRSDGRPIGAIGVWLKDLDEGRA